MFELGKKTFWCHLNVVLFLDLAVFVTQVLHRGIFKVFKLLGTILAQVEEQLLSDWKSGNLINLEQRFDKVLKLCSESQYSFKFTLKKSFGQISKEKVWFSPSKIISQTDHSCQILSFCCCWCVCVCVCVCRCVCACVCVCVCNGITLLMWNQVFSVCLFCVSESDWSKTKRRISVRISYNLWQH